MTNDEAESLKEGDRIKAENGRIYTVARVEPVQMGPIKIWVKETWNYLLPGQAEAVGQFDRSE